MDHEKTEIFLEGIEIAIAMQQAMPCFEAKSCYETIDRLAHGMAATAQKPVVRRQLLDHDVPAP